ncbi:putative Sulfotransferase domain-containing protein [Gammaproteobacteria bacterium]
MNFSKKFNKILHQLAGYPLTAANPRHSDLYLVEYPKSGITWLSVLLANAALIRSGRPEIAHYANAHVFIPDINISRSVGQPVYGYPSCRIIKSHSTWNPNYKFVIYLARHPVPVLKSFYRFLSELNQCDASDFDAFVRSSRFGVPAWKRHVSSWLMSSNLQNRLHLVRYEDLLNDPLATLLDIDKNFGWGIGKDALSGSVERSTKDIMRESEEFYRIHDPRYNIEFVGGQNKFMVHPDTEDFIRHECADLLALMKYSPNDGTPI